MAERDAFGNPIEQRGPTGVPGGVPSSAKNAPRESTEYRPREQTRSRPARRVSVGSYGTLSLVVLVTIIVIGALVIALLGLSSR